MTEETQLVGAVKDLKASLDKLRDELVRKDVYTAQREADQKNVADVADDVKDIQDTLRWLSRALIGALVFPLLSSLFLLYVAGQVNR